MSSELFRQIEEVFPSITGWCSLQRAQELAAMVIALRPFRSCIIGVWGGKDTIPLAMAHRAIGYGKVIAVDPWQAEASVVGQDQANVDWWGDQQKHELVYQRFLDLVNQHGLSDWVDIRRQKSDDVQITEALKFLGVDGNHGPQAVVDVNRFAPLVPIGGIVYLDDLHWTGGAVEQAEQALLLQGFIRSHTRDTGAFYQRVS